MGRVAEPGEIAPAIAWLLGPESSYITGASIRVAGGLRTSDQEAGEALAKCPAGG